jgi:hypothetical protein
MGFQQWEYCSLTIDHYDDADYVDKVTFIQYTLVGPDQEVVRQENFGQFLAQLGREGWELAGVSSDQPLPPGVRHRESWVFKRPLS